MSTVAVAVAGLAVGVAAVLVEPTWVREGGYGKYENKDKDRHELFHSPHSFSFSIVSTYSFTATSETNHSSSIFLAVSLSCFIRSSRGDVKGILYLLLCVIELPSNFFRHGFLPPYNYSFTHSLVYSNTRYKAV